MEDAIMNDETPQEGPTLESLDKDFLLEIKWIAASAPTLLFTGAVALWIGINDGLGLLITSSAKTILSATLGGLLVGATQWWILRSRIPNGRTWMAVTAGGWVLSALFMVLILFREDYWAMLIGTGLLGGVVVGLLQWFVFWRRSQIGWLWPLLSAIGAVIGIVIAFAVGAIVGFFFRSTHMAVEGALIGVIAGTIHGALTAVVLRRILMSLIPQKALPGGYD